MRIDSFPRVDREARRLLEKMSIVNPAVDVERIAQTLGLNVIRQQFQEDLSAVLVKSGNASTIGINSKHPRARQRFSIAHELGHYWLDHPGDMFVDKTTATVLFRDGRSGDGTSLHEMEANRFAAALLMPPHFLIESFMERSGTFGVTEMVASLAKQYEVSQQAMKIRLSSLGLINLA